MASSHGQWPGEFSKLTFDIVGELLNVLPERSSGSSKFSVNLFWSTLAVVETSPMASSNGEFSKLTVAIVGNCQMFL